MSESDIRLLLIDDDDIDRMGVRRALKQAGVAFTAVEATDGNTGLHLLGQQQFDCVFCDYLLTDGDGLSLLKRVRAAGIEVPFIMLTGHGDERLAVEMMQARANDYLPKDQMTPEAHAQTHTHKLNQHKDQQKNRAAKQQIQKSNDAGSACASAHARIAPAQGRTGAQGGGTAVTRVESLYRRDIGEHL